MARPAKAAPRRFAILLAGLAALLVLTGAYLRFLGGTNPDRSAAIGGPFTLISSDGRIVTDRSFSGRYLLIYFGYSSCQDVCPTTLTAVAGALDALGARAARIQPLFITVDPRRDTPAALHAYVANFSPRLIGLTGTAEQLRAVQREYRATAIMHPGSSGLVGYGIDHSSVLLLMAPDGSFVAPIRADSTSAEMAQALAMHLT